jgi:hypothetical protein
MGPTALLPLRRKVCYGFYHPQNPSFSAGFEPASLGSSGKHAKTLSKMSIPPQMKCVNHPQYWNRFLLTSSFSSCMTFTRYGWNFNFLQANVHFRRIIYSEQKVFSVTFVESVTRFDGYRPNSHHVTPSDEQNGFCPAHFLCHGIGSPDEILSICLAQDNREMYPYTNSDTLSTNEMPGGIRQWTLVALVKKTSWHFDCLKKNNGLARAVYNITWHAWALA